MRASLQASTSGLARIKQARKEKGWTIEDERWLLAASKIVDPDKEWPPGSGYYADGCSEKTWKRFLRGTSISAATFKAFSDGFEKSTGTKIFFMSFGFKLSLRIIVIAFVGLLTLDRMPYIYF